MKNIIGGNSSNGHSRMFSLDEFFDSDAPGTLSWLNNMDANDLNIDIRTLNEVGLSSLVTPCVATELTKQITRCQFLCAWCSSMQIKLSDKTKLLFISNREIK